LGGGKKENRRHNRQQIEALEEKRLGAYLRSTNTSGQGRTAKKNNSEGNGYSRLEAEAFEAPGKNKNQRKEGKEARVGGGMNYLNSRSKSWGEGKGLKGTSNFWAEKSSTRLRTRKSGSHKTRGAPSSSNRNRSQARQIGRGREQKGRKACSARTGRQVATAGDRERGRKTAFLK